MHDRPGAISSHHEAGKELIPETLLDRTYMDILCKANAAVECVGSVRMVGEEKRKRKRREEEVMTDREDSGDRDGDGEERLRLRRFWQHGAGTLRLDMLAVLSSDGAT